MPNGHDKNWARLLTAIDAFRLRHNSWPTRVRMHPGSIRNIQEDLFTPESFKVLTQKVLLIADENLFTAEDDQGKNYCVTNDGVPSKKPIPDAREWLGIQPDKPHAR